MKKPFGILLSIALTSSIVVAGCYERRDDCHLTGSCTDGAGGTSTGGDGGAGNSTSGGGGANPCAGVCDGETPECDGSTGECVECTTESGCDDGVCDTDTHRCVACLEDADCTSPDAARCDAGECKPCTNGTQCAGVDGKNACDTTTGTCVECTAGDESACGSNSCDPATNECTETERGSRTRCRSCVADSECQENYRCVPMEFQGEPREGGYCLKVLDTGCAKPLTSPTPPRISLSGADATVYCGVSESRTTCEAVLDLLADTECPGGTDDECGIPGLNDARCELVNGVANRCTYSCATGNQCPDDHSCGSDPNDYCGAVL